MDNKGSDLDREVIDVIELRPMPKVIELKDAFELREDRPAVWLQRICLWTLRKLGCFACKETVTIERHVIGKNGKTFMDRLWTRRTALLRNELNREPTRLLLGAKDYEELMGEVCTQGFSFASNYNMGRNGRPEIMGLTVEVIPHMSGLLFL